MPFLAPYNPPAYPKLQTSKASLLTSVGQGQVGGSNYFYFSIGQSSPTNMVATVQNPLGLLDLGSLYGIGNYGHTYIPRTFYDGGYGLQFKATVYIQYDASWVDWSFAWYWTGMPGGIIQYGNMEKVNGGSNGTYVKATFDSGILVPGSDYGITALNGGLGVTGTEMYPNIQGTVGTDPLVNVGNSPGLEIFAWSF